MTYSKLSLSGGRGTFPCADAGNSGLMFSMKILFAVFALITTYGVAFAEDETVGRYQLVPGIIEIIGKGGMATQEHVIMRIDTKTGKTWEYASGVGKDGKMNSFWGQIPDKPLVGE
jgi:hypothetical protein